MKFAAVSILPAVEPVQYALVSLFISVVFLSSETNTGLLTERSIIDFNSVCVGKRQFVDPP